MADNGFLVRFGDHFLSPDIPDGNVTTGQDIGPLTPQVSTGSVIVGYFDFNRKILYLIPIQIQPSCP